MPDLKLDWCSHQAAKFACEHWHYSRSLPVAKTVKIGVWEDSKFIGVVLYSWGANPNLSKAYKLKMSQCAELVRVALTKHQSAVSRVLAIAQKMLKKQSPGLRLLVSFADMDQNHHGGIYQAAGWLYSGTTPAKKDFMLNGRKLQRRGYTGQVFGRERMKLPAGAITVDSLPKHRYLMPLDSAMRAQIEPLRQPYPKREVVSND